MDNFYLLNDCWKSKESLQKFAYLVIIGCFHFQITHFCEAMHFVKWMWHCWKPSCFPESHSVVNEGQESRQIFVLSGHFSILKLAPNQQVWWIKSMVHFHNGSLSQELSKVHLVQELWKNLLVRPEFGILYLNWFL